MWITILYSLWIAYTVGSLSVVGLVAILSIISKYEHKKNRERIDAILSRNKTELEEEGW